MRFILILFFLPAYLYLGAQDTKFIEIRRTDEPIKLDGVLDEAWFQSDSAKNFWQQFPSDSSMAEAQTVVYMLYDDNYVYVAAILKNPNSDRSYVTPSLRRDFRGEANDSFSVVFDPFKDRTNGFLFGINPFGVRREGLITNGGSGRRSFSLDWDNKWDGEAKTYEGYWVAEMAIPFKTLRFAEDSKEWLVNFYRVDSDLAERSSWTRIPRIYSIINMASYHSLRWESGTPKPGSNISFIPYVAASTAKDFEEGTDEQKLNAGFDVKYGVTAGLNLDLTINPDFSQVEVDRQVTNLDRFEIFFPERRQFFLENADLFADFGSFSARPFFSRRIGVAQDTSTGQNIQNPIPFGARLSGKVTDNTRIGLLNMQAAKDASINQPSVNYTVATMQQKVFARSNIGFIFVNKQPMSLTKGDSTYNQPANRTVGVDFNLASADNVWNGKAYFHHSFDEVQPDSAFSMGISVDYVTTKWDINITTRSIGAGYNPEVGFVRRTDIQQFAGDMWYNFFPSGGPFQSHGPGWNWDIVRNDTYGPLDWDINAMYRIRFRNTANFNMRLRRQYTFLFNSFDPSGSDGPELPEGTGYTNNQIIARFESDARKRFFFEFSTRSGEYFNGTRLNLGGTVGYRYQPYGSASIDFTINRIQLPEPYNSSNLYLVGPRFDFTFTRKLFWTTFVQYNSQIENLNINSRLQWRFKPVSDIFLVYTDNYVAYNEDVDFIRFGGSKNRALVFKLTYWLNL